MQKLSGQDAELVRFFQSNRAYDLQLARVCVELVRDSYDCRPRFRRKNGVEESVTVTSWATVESGPPVVALGSADEEPTLPLRALGNIHLSKGSYVLGAEGFDSPVEGKCHRGSDCSGSDIDPDDPDCVEEGAFWCVSSAAEHMHNFCGGFKHCSGCVVVVVVYLLSTYDSRK